MESKVIMKSLVAYLLFLFVSCYCLAATYYVDADATGGATGADWTNAFTDPCDAINVADAGDLILIDNDTYTHPGGTYSTYIIDCDLANTLPTGWDDQIIIRGVDKEDSDNEAQFTLNMESTNAGIDLASYFVIENVTFSNIPNADTLCIGDSAVDNVVIDNVHVVSDDTLYNHVNVDNAAVFVDCTIGAADIALVADGSVRVINCYIYDFSDRGVTCENGVVINTVFANDNATTEALEFTLLTQSANIVHVSNCTFDMQDAATTVGLSINETGIVGVGAIVNNLFHDCATGMSASETITGWHIDYNTYDSCVAQTDGNISTGQNVATTAQSFVDSASAFASRDYTPGTEDLGKDAAGEFGASDAIYKGAVQPSGGGSAATLANQTTMINNLTTLLSYFDGSGRVDVGEILGVAVPAFNQSGYLRVDTQYIEGAVPADPLVDGVNAIQIEGADATDRLDAALSNAGVTSTRMTYLDDLADGGRLDLLIDDIKSYLDTEIAEIIRRVKTLGGF